MSSLSLAVIKAVSDTGWTERVLSFLTSHPFPKGIGGLQRTRALLSASNSIMIKNSGSYQRSGYDNKGGRARPNI